MTRPLKDAVQFCAALNQVGLTGIASPVINILFDDCQPDLVGVTALAFTSANGVRAFCRLHARRTLPVFAVGPSTTNVAIEHGFDDVFCAGGDVVALASLIEKTLRVKAQRKQTSLVFHGAGSVQKGDLARRLDNSGITCRRQVLYRAEPIDAMVPQARDHLQSQPEKTAIVFFSPRSADLFLSQIAHAGMSALIRQSMAICLSETVARHARKADWGSVKIARAATASAMLDVLRP